MNLLLNECLRVFGVKENPVVAFWFIPTVKVDNGSADFPKDFENYNLYKKADVFGVNYSCYAKKAVNGCFSDKYWKVEA